MRFFQRFMNKLSTLTYDVNVHLSGNIQFENFIQFVFVYLPFRINHTIILDDPFDDPEGLEIPDQSPEPSKDQLEVGAHN